MSVVLNYENQTIQHSDLAGNIAHQGVLGSNVNGTTLLSSTFPSTSTGSSLGHYHYTESTTNALKFLNVSGSGSGGHKFYTSNSTNAPVNTASIGLDGLIINTNVKNTNNLTNLDLNNNELTLSSSSNNIQLSATQSTLRVRNNTTSDVAYVQNDRVAVGNDINNTAMSIYSTITRMSDPTYWNTNTSSSLVINKRSTREQSELTSNTLTLKDTSTNTSTLNSSSLTLTNSTNTAFLTETDLTFNGVSLPTTVSTNTSNIATNTSNIATNTNNITNLTIKQITSSNQFVSAVITADGRPPTAPTNTIINTYGFSPAWYFKNSFSSGVNKINWYLGPSIGMTVSQVLGLYMNIFNGLTTSNDNSPFLVIYTANDSVPPVNFYKSKRTYLFNQSITPVANTRYLTFANVSGSCPTPNYYGSNLNNMELSTVSGSQVGAFASTELILAFAINTNSASALNSVEFAINKFGIMTPFGTQEILFIPSS